MANIFLSWSKPEGREVATCLKEFLIDVLNIKDSSKVFLSTQNIIGDDGWYNDIRSNASSAYIIIPCLTRNSLHSPWIHFETGIGSSIIKNKPKMIIPFLFDLLPNELGANLGMMSFHQLVYSDQPDLVKKYSRMLTRLVYSIDAYLNKHLQNIKPIFGNLNYPRQYNDETDPRIQKDHNLAIANASEHLARIKNKYQAYNFYISRPMQSVTASDASEYQSVIESWGSNKNYSLFYAKLNCDVEVGFSTSRIAIIKDSQYFVLIYPNMKEANLSPTSCLVELGGAIAFGKRIVLFIEEGSNVPNIIKDLKTGIGDKFLFTYTSIQELNTCWEKFLNTIKEK